MQDIFDRQVLGSTLTAPALALARQRSPGELHDLVADAGLLGKGGGGFPVHRKLALMQAQPGGPRHLVVNAGEHEPGSAKDRHLLLAHPLTVLEGALILAHAASADVVHLAVPDTAGPAIARLEAAIAQVRQAHDGLPEIRLATVPESYIVGEESALLEALSGRPPLPRKRPPYPIQSGLDGGPTLVQNVETVAHLPYLVLFGAARYLALSPAGLGVTLCTFGEEFARPGVRLVPLGLPLREVLTELGGGLASGKPIQAVQTGGPSGGFLLDGELDVAFDHASLQRAGAALGCGVIRAFDEDEDMARVVCELMDFFTAHSCGQCPGCRMQTQMLQRIMHQTLAGNGSEKLFQQVPRLIQANADKGICGFIHMPGPPILSAARKFDSLKHHTHRGST